MTQVLTTIDSSHGCRSLVRYAPEPPAFWVPVEGFARCCSLAPDGGSVHAALQSKRPGFRPGTHLTAFGPGPRPGVRTVDESKLV